MKRSPCSLQEGDRVPQLSVGRDLHADAHQRGLRHRGRTPGAAPSGTGRWCDARCRSGERRSGDRDIDILGLGEAEQLGVEALRRIDIGDEQLDRADLGDLERPLQHHAAHAIVVRQFLGRDGTRCRGRCRSRSQLHDLRHLGRLRQREAVAHLVQIGRRRLAPAVPADLLHAVVELDAVSVRIEHVERPVAAGKIAARAG